MEGLLAAEVVDDRREVGFRLLGDLARGRALEAVAAEDVERRLDQALPGLGAAVADGRGDSGGAPFGRATGNVLPRPSRTAQRRGGRPALSQPPGDLYRHAANRRHFFSMLQSLAISRF